MQSPHVHHQESRKFIALVFPELDVNCFIGKPIANEDLVRIVKESIRAAITNQSTIKDRKADRVGKQLQSLV